MSFRGRGGRGGGGRAGRGGRGGFGASTFNIQGKHTPHENFLEITLPPEMKRAVLTKEEEFLRDSTLNFEEFMRNSCYHLELHAPKKKNDDKEIKRFSDRKHKTYSKREPLKSYLKLTPGNFPAELLDDDKAFEVFEKLEEKHNKEGENKAEKDGEEEDDDEDEEEVEEEESSDDDYNQNIEFDDDDDDWNQEEEAHEDCYD